MGEMGARAKTRAKSQTTRMPRNLSESSCHLVHVHVLGNCCPSCWSIPGILGMVVHMEKRKRDIGAFLAEVLRVLVLIGVDRDDGI